MYKLPYPFSKISCYSGQALEKGIKMKNTISIQTEKFDQLHFFFHLRKMLALTMQRMYFKM